MTVNEICAQKIQLSLKSLPPVSEFSFSIE